MARGRYDDTKGTPNVDERCTPWCFYRDFCQAHTPRLEFEGVTNYQPHYRSDSILFLNVIILGHIGC